MVEKCNVKDIRSFFEQKSENLMVENEKNYLLNGWQSQEFTRSGCRNEENKTYPSSAIHELMTPQNSGLSLIRLTNTDVQTEPPDSNNFLMTQTVIQTEPTDSELDFKIIPPPNSQPKSSE